MKQPASGIWTRQLSLLAPPRSLGRTHAMGLHLHPLPHTAVLSVSSHSRPFPWFPGAYQRDRRQPSLPPANWLPAWMGNSPSRTWLPLSPLQTKQHKGSQLSYKKIHVTNLIISWVLYNYCTCVVCFRYWNLVIHCNESGFCSHKLTLWFLFGRVSNHHTLHLVCLWLA